MAKANTGHTSDQAEPIETIMDSVSEDEDDQQVLADAMGLLRTQLQRATLEDEVTHALQHPALLALANHRNIPTGKDLKQETAEPLRDLLRKDFLYGNGFDALLHEAPVLSKYPIMPALLAVCAEQSLASLLDAVADRTDDSATQLVVDCLLLHCNSRAAVAAVMPLRICCPAYSSKLPVISNARY